MISKLLWKTLSDCSKSIRDLEQTKLKLASSEAEWNRKEAVLVAAAQEIERKLSSAEARVKELENADKAIRDCVKWANGREYESGERIENAFGFLHRYLDATMPRKDS